MAQEYPQGDVDLATLPEVGRALLNSHRNSLRDDGLVLCAV
jgi:hypothetical protein